MTDAKLDLEDIIVVKFKELERRIADLFADEAALACGQSCRPGCSDSCKAGGKTGSLTSPTSVG